MTTRDETLEKRDNADAIISKAIGDNVKRLRVSDLFVGEDSG
jgi:hypothetical protein